MSEAASSGGGANGCSCKPCRRDAVVTAHRPHGLSPPSRPAWAPLQADEETAAQAAVGDGAGGAPRGPGQAWASGLASALALHSPARRLHLRGVFPPSVGWRGGSVPKSQRPAQEAGAAPSTPAPAIGLAPPLVPNDPPSSESLENRHGGRLDPDQPILQTRNLRPPCAQASGSPPAGAPGLGCSRPTGCADGPTGQRRSCSSAPPAGQRAQGLEADPGPRHPPHSPPTVCLILPNQSCKLRMTQDPRRLDAPPARGRACLSVTQGCYPRMSPLKCVRARRGPPKGLSDPGGGIVGDLDLILFCFSTVC